jgi:flagellar biosynthetic protein FlhB
VAETDTGQERTEQPTPKRLDKAREEGQVARSRELTTTFVLLAGAGGLLIFGDRLAGAAIRLCRGNFAFEVRAGADPALMIDHLWRSLALSVNALLPLFLLLLVGAIAGSVALGGVLISAKAVQPQLKRLNPLSGLKRMLGLNAWVELGKAVAKFVLVAGIALLLLSLMQGRVLALGAQALEPAVVEALRIVLWTVLGVSSAMILVAAVDVPYQLYDHNKKLMMTRQEIRDEMKDTEGKPEVKGRIRQLQREMAQRRMMEEVPRADVVITNPEHFSVALRYAQDSDRAPVVVAKGSDHLAMKIREIANAHNVPLLPAPALARAIYYTTELEDSIPAPLYLAVAQVLAYVFQLKAYRPGRDQRPQAPRHLDIPSAMLFDSRGKRYEASS